MDSADDLRKCLAFDAVTAVHVADLTVLARERPETPAAEAFPDEDVELLHTLLESQGHRNVVRMPDGKAPDIRAVVIDLGRLVGSHPSARQPLPGTKKVCRDSSGCTGRSRSATPSERESANRITYTSVAL